MTVSGFWEQLLLSGNWFLASSFSESVSGSGKRLLVPGERFLSSGFSKTVYGFSEAILVSENGFWCLLSRDLLLIS